MIKTILFCIWFFSFLGTWGMFINCRHYAKRLHSEKNSSHVRETLSAKIVALMAIIIISIVPIVNTFFTFVFITKREDIYDKIEEDNE